MTPDGGELRVLQLHNRYRERGGEDEVVDAQHEALLDAGFDTRLLEFANPLGSFAAGIDLLLAPWNPRSVGTVKSTIETWRPDVAHVHNTWFSASPSTIEAFRRMDIPVLMTLHNYRLTCLNAQLLRDGRPCEVCVGSHPWQGVRYRCYRDSAISSIAAASTISLNRRMKTFERGVSRFTVLTEFQKSLMTDSGLDPDHLTVIPNFVNDPGARTSMPSSGEFVLYVGRLSPEKGIDRLVDAWDRLRPRRLRLVVLGDGPLRGALEAKRVPGVDIRGPASSDAVKSAMLSAHSLAYPSICYEGQPLVLLEAMAAGLPIAAQTQGAVGSTVGDAGLIAYGDWTETLDQLTKMSDDHLDSIGSAGRARYDEQFTKARVVGLLGQAYQEVTRAA